MVLLYHESKNSGMWATNARMYVVMFLVWYTCKNLDCRDFASSANLVMSVGENDSEDKSELSLQNSSVQMNWVLATFGMDGKCGKLILPSNVCFSGPRMSHHSNFFVSLHT